MQPPELTLRDFFAAAALTGMLRNFMSGSEAPDFAKWAYEQADAMLVERRNSRTTMKQHETESIRADEREACALIADHVNYHTPGLSVHGIAYKSACGDIAQKIRERGTDSGPRGQIAPLLPSHTGVRSGLYRCNDGNCFCGGLE